MSMNSVEDIFNFVEGEIEIRIESVKIEIETLEEQLVNELERRTRIKALNKERNIGNEESLFLSNYQTNIKSNKIGFIRNEDYLKLDFLNSSTLNYEDKY